MDRNLEMQARMIEDLLQKNSNITENTLNNKNEMPRMGYNSPDHGAKGSILNTSLKNATGSFINDEQLINDPCFANFVNINTIQYIKDQFNTMKNTQQATTDNKNVSFRELSHVVDELVLRLYYVFVVAQQ